MCDLGDYTTSEVRYREAFQLFGRVRDPLGKSLSNAGLAWVAHYTGAYEAAREHSERALLFAGEIGAGVATVSATLVLGHTLSAERRWSDATAAYQRTLALCQRMSWQNWALSAHAGLARIALARGAPEDALPHAEEILRRVAIGPDLYGTYDPIRVYLSCYRALQASNDSRAEETLQMAHRLLQAWASSIADEDLRRSFLENVAAHREIGAAYAGAG
jgi:tetratricopeptide (TPR) repeat protein